MDPDELYLFAKVYFDVRLPSRVSYVHAINEQEGKGQGSVTLDSDGRPSLTWHVSDVTVASIQRNLAAFADLMGAELHLPPHSISRRLFSGAHHSGTCRIASNRDEGVVDENLLVDGAERIYVCDGSVLPSTGASNTGLTIGALAHRLVDHLKSTCFGT